MPKLIYNHPIPRDLFLGYVQTVANEANLTIADVTQGAGLERNRLYRTKPIWRHLMAIVGFQAVKFGKIVPVPQELIDHISIPVLSIVSPKFIRVTNTSPSNPDTP